MAISSTVSRSLRGSCSTRAAARLRLVKQDDDDDDEDDDDAGLDEEDAEEAVLWADS